MHGSRLTSGTLLTQPMRWVNVVMWFTARYLIGRSLTDPQKKLKFWRKSKNSAKVSKLKFDLKNSDNSVNSTPTYWKQSMWRPTQAKVRRPGSGMEMWPLQNQQFYRPQILPLHPRVDFRALLRRHHLCGLVSLALDQKAKSDSKISGGLWSMCLQENVLKKSWKIMGFLCLVTYQKSIKSA